MYSIFCIQEGVQRGHCPDRFDLIVAAEVTASQRDCNTACLEQHRSSGRFQGDSLANVTMLPGQAPPIESVYTKNILNIAIPTDIKTHQI